MRLENHLIIRNLFILHLIFFILHGCATKEDIKRNELVEKLKGDMQGQQNITKSLLLKIYNIENSLGNVSGQIETAQHSLELTEQNTLEELKSRVNSIEKEYKGYVLDTNAEISKLHLELKKQKVFLSNLLKEIKNLSQSNRKDNQLSLFSRSIRNYQNQKYENAKNQFLEIVNDIEAHRLNKRDQALVFHNLGMTFYIQKDYKNSQIYFSKLFTKYSSSPLNSSALYHLGMTFKEQNKENEAAEMWNLLKKKYPKSKYTALARKELSGK